MITFAGQVRGLRLDLNAVVRLTPNGAPAGALPPLPAIDTLVPLQSQMGTVQALVLTARRDVLELEADQVVWRLRPLKPSEITFAASYVAGSGATDWIVSHGAPAR